MYANHGFFPPSQGSWNLEGNKLVGTFTRKDNGKVLTAYREIVGSELIQVS